MINPISHTTTEEKCNQYKLEPYVMAADVYIRKPHDGRGGWSWYTGTAGWMYKVGIENILGLKLYKGEGYNIKVKKSDKEKIIINGKQINSDIIPRNLGKANIEVYYK